MAQKDYIAGRKSALAGATDAEKAQLFRLGGAKEDDIEAVRDYWTGAYDALLELHAALQN